MLFFIRECDTTAHPSSYIPNKLNLYHALSRPTENVKGFSDTYPRKHTIWILG